MTYEEDIFDDAVLTELDEALDMVMAAIASVARTTGRGDGVEAARALRVLTSVDLLRRSCGLQLGWADRPVREKYRIIATGVGNVLSAWGDAPPQFAKYCVPEEVYERLYPLYVKARDRATGVE